MKNRHRLYVVSLVLFLALSFIVPYTVFLIRPSIFYWRAWEYFSEVVYPNSYRTRVWNGFEKGDMTRSYLFYFQDKYFTHVSTDADGFRLGPYYTDEYKILVYGDSHCWGSRLSNNETFSWRLALKLHKPVFNGGRETLLRKILGKNELRKVNLVINVIDAMHVKIKELFPDNFIIDEYVPMKEYNKVSLSVKRFYPTSFIIRAAKIVKNDISIVKNNNDNRPYLCGSEYKVPFFDNENDVNKVYRKKNSLYEEILERQVEMISNFSRQLLQRGYIYILVLVPRKDLLYADKVDEYSKEYFPRLIRKLEEEGVYAVDLQKDFIANKDKGLFFHTDTHWNERGTEIAAEVVTRYLREKGLLNNVLLTKN
ncbi:MAG: hypothetical protein KA807_00920 [Prolixibacteraceae bacterium]|nr:hypothetical protein [Prolixibacteraceae bacterium]